MLMKDRVEEGEKLFVKGYDAYLREPKNTLVSDRKFLKDLEKSARYKNAKALFVLGYFLCVPYKDLPVNVKKGKKVLQKAYPGLLSLSNSRHDPVATKFLSEYYRVPLADFVKDDSKVKELVSLSKMYEEEERSPLLQEKNPASGGGSSENDSLVLAITALESSEEQTEETEENLKMIVHSAEGGNIRACLYLGELYSEGKYVERDADKARAYLRKAEECGSVKAKYLLGKEEVEGNFSSPYITEGLNRIYSAAKAGLKEAQFYLGKIYYEGKVVGQDYQKAYLYFQASYHRGEEEARSYLNRIENLQGDRALILERQEKEKEKSERK
jgi:TPR repeat protein